jgi:hypothetical protein
MESQQRLLLLQFSSVLPARAGASYGRGGESPNFVAASAIDPFPIYSFKHDAESRRE